MKHVLITGGFGKLGSALCNIMKDVYLGTRDNFDFTNFAMMQNFFNQNSEINTIIHCGAMVSPPKVNELVDQAIHTNIVGTGLLSMICHQRGLRLIYISTDYVFSGEK
jgi:dTDP-4-dehydrorhamnose reductase